MKLQKGKTVYVAGGKKYRGELPDKLAHLVKDVPSCQIKQEPKPKKEKAMKKEGDEAG